MGALEHTIAIAGQEIPLLADAATPLRYRNWTGRDYFRDMAGIDAAAIPRDESDQASREAQAYAMGAAMDFAVRVAWVMARAAAPSSKKFPAYDKWLGQFPMASLMELGQQVLPIIGVGDATQSEAKVQGKE